MKQMYESIRRHLVNRTKKEEKLNRNNDEMLNAIHLSIDENKGKTKKIKHEHWV